jgi:formylglycine-generating enzyme required for sulfatase activity
MQRALLVPRAALAALAAVLAAACSDPNLGAQRFRCDRDDDCGPGWRCVAGLCAAPGAHADTGGADAGGADAGGADTGGAATGSTDVGGADAGGADAGRTDVGGADAGRTDVGGADVSRTDAGGADAGVLPPGLTWVRITGGTFPMGCSVGDASCASNEQPRHAVTVRSFAILETEVTEAQYAALMDGADPSCDWGGGGGDDSPVECVDWHAARTFCQRAGGRLCSEAEWEYAARGGTTTAYACGDRASCLNGYAWYAADSKGHKRDVKTWVSPNGYGLYDLYGNVWEWVEDDWHGSYDGAPGDGTAWANHPRATGRVFRGGGFSSTATGLRASNRGYDDPAHPIAYVGLRCCRSWD